MDKCAWCQCRKFDQNDYSHTRPAGILQQQLGNGIWPATWPIYTWFQQRIWVMEFQVLGLDWATRRSATVRIWLPCLPLGWKDSTTVYNTLKEFRSGNYPIDAWISDFVSRTCCILIFLLSHCDKSNRSFFFFRMLQEWYRAWLQLAWPRIPSFNFDSTPSYFHATDQLKTWRTESALWWYS